MNRALTTKHKSRLHDSIKKGRYLSVGRFNHNEFQVTECINEQIVDYEVIFDGVFSTCTCGFMVARRFPCIHILRVCSAANANINPYMLCPFWYVVSYYRQTYALIFIQWQAHNFGNMYLVQRWLHLYCDTLLDDQRLNAHVCTWI